MLRIQRRIEKLERALSVSEHISSLEFTIDFIDADGKVASTMVLSEGVTRWDRRETERKVSDES
jgi:hypothetical protein